MVQPFEVVIKSHERPQRTLAHDDSASDHSSVTLKMAEDQILSNVEMTDDIDALLDAATAALSGKDKTAIKPASISSVQKSGLISTTGGVAKLNPDVLIKQNEKQADVQQREKVGICLIHWSDEVTDMMTNFLSVASFTGSS